MKPFDELASEESINKAAEALKANGIEVFVADNAAAARQKVFELIPGGSEVMDMTSETLNTLGLSKEINESGKFEPVRVKLTQLGNDQGKQRQKKALGAAPAISIGSVHAVTEDGRLLIASNTGSQLPAYAYGSDKVVWVVGTQKIVKDLDEGIKRVYDYVLPKETVRARAAYNQPDTFHSFVSKLLVFNREVAPNRVKVVFVKQVLGF